MKIHNIIKLKGAFLVFIVMIFFASCQWTTIEPVVPEIPDEPVSFSSVIQPVFTAKCVQCHPSSGGLDLSEGNAYSNINNNDYINLTTPEESLIYTKGDPAGSHFGKYSITEAALLLKWIEEGALNN